ncbi:MAG: phosphoethanolamine transferase [Bacteroidales bacterium]|nr:phosphoethanolamine transferase [Bacteroidales bacterium]
MTHPVTLILIATALCLLGTPSLGALAVAMLLLAPTALLKKRLGAPLGVVLTFVMGLACLADVFCQEFFLSPLNTGTVRLLFATHPAEVWSFCKTFVSPAILGRWRLSVCLVLLLATPFAVKWSLPNGLLAVLAVPAAIGLFHLDKTPPGRLVSAGAEAFRQDREAEIRHKVYFTETADTCTFRSARIVLVLGESFNKHHASAYGYRLPTTPFQDARGAGRSLFFFADAVSPCNMTADVFERMFSVPFPAILKRAGYTVNFYSNQFPGGNGFMAIRGGKNMFSDKTISEAAFSYRNTHTKQFDADFLADNLPPANALAQEPVMDIIHLRGQHFEYEEHYPPDFAFFSMDDYPEGTPEAVMHYDNATRYNDFVLESILQYYAATDAIVIFLSDHGEEVYDELPISGRSHGRPGLAAARAEYEVPMWVWCSTAYAAAHPDVLEALPQAAARPFYTSDLSHLLLDLAGVSGPFTSKERSILSPSYHCPARIIAGKVDYDKLRAGE